MHWRLMLKAPPPAQSSERLIGSPSAGLDHRCAAALAASVAPHRESCSCVAVAPAPSSAWHPARDAGIALEGQRRNEPVGRKPLQRAALAGGEADGRCISADPSSGPTMSHSSIDHRIRARRSSTGRASATCWRTKSKKAPPVGRARSAGRHPSPAAGAAHLLPCCAGRHRAHRASPVLCEHRPGPPRLAAEVRGPSAGPLPPAHIPAEIGRYAHRTRGRHPATFRCS
jgi:hypothetical protein